MKFAKIGINKRDMFSFILAFSLIGCGVHNHNGKAALANNIAVVAPLPYIQPDTIHVRVNDKIKIAPIYTREKHLVKTGVLPPYDSLLKEHFSVDSDKAALTVRYFRVADSARLRKQRNDSLYALVKDISNQQRIGNAKADSFYRLQLDNKRLERQNQTYSKSADGMFWTAFSVLMIILIAHTALLAKIRKAQKRTNYLL